MNPETPASGDAAGFPQNFPTTTNFAAAQRGRRRQLIVSDQGRQRPDVSELLRQAAVRRQDE
jgi:hypothetical protein